MSGQHLLVAVAAMCVLSTSEAQKPNILFLLADDVGWADYQINDPQMRTPNILKLASDGLTMNQSYTMMTCTPSRSALMSGRDPFSIGMQAGAIHGSAMKWLPENLKLMPQALKELGYDTHMVGKWHLGHCDWKLTPTLRGFDSFVGIYGSSNGYFNHSGQNPGSYDLRFNLKPYWEANGVYATDVYTDRVIKLIRQRTAKPFFIYMAYQLAHAPFEALQKHLDICSHISDPLRKMRCAMMAALDESIGKIRDILISQDKADNTIIVYMADNGGPVNEASGSYNWPLRGGKANLYEGGTRAYTVVVHPGKTPANAVSNGLFQMPDWYPTLYAAAGGDVEQLKLNVPLDGKNQLNLIRGGPSVRDRLIYNVDDSGSVLQAAVRINDFKLMLNAPKRGWLPSPYYAQHGFKANEPKPKEWMLFNVINDPEERFDLYRNASYASIVAELKKYLNNEKPRIVPWPKPLSYSDYGSTGNYGGVVSPGYCCVNV